MDTDSANANAFTVSCDIVGRYVSIQLWMDQMSLSLAEVEITVRKLTILINILQIWKERFGKKEIN